MAGAEWRAPSSCCTPGGLLGCASLAVPNVACHALDHQPGDECKHSASSNIICSTRHTRHRMDGDPMVAMCLFDNRSPNMRITEWIRFHRNVGASLFVIFDDRPSKGRLEDATLFDVLGGAAAHVIRRLPPKTDNLAVKPFKQVGEVMPACARVASARGVPWVIHTDIDEYTYPMMPHPDLVGALRSFKPSPCVLLPRFAFGADQYGRSGNKSIPSELVRTFLTRAPYPLSTARWKSLLLQKQPAINLSALPTSLTGSTDLLGRPTRIRLVFDHPDFTTLGKVAIHIPTFFKNGKPTFAMSQHALMPFGTRWESGLEPLSDAPSLSQMGERSTNQVCASSAPSVIRINHYVGSFAEFLSRVDVPDGFERRFSATYPAQFDVRDLNVVRDLNALRWTCGSRQHAPTASGCEGHPPGPLVVLNEPRIEESSRGSRAPRRDIDEPKRAAPPSPLRTGSHAGLGQPAGLHRVGGGARRGTPPPAVLPNL